MTNERVSPEVTEAERLREINRELVCSHNDLLLVTVRLQDEVDELRADLKIATASYRKANDLLENIQAMVFEWDSPEESLTEFGKGAAHLARKVMAYFRAAALTEEGE